MSRVVVWCACALAAAAGIGGCGSELTSSLIMEPGSVAQIQVSGAQSKVTLVNQGPAGLGVQPAQMPEKTALGDGEKFSYHPNDGRAVILHNGEEQRTVLEIHVRRWAAVLITQDGDIVVKSLGEK